MTSLVVAVDGTIATLTVSNTLVDLILTESATFELSLDGVTTN